jgi:hypothetical protein
MGTSRWSIAVVAAFLAACNGLIGDPGIPLEESENPDFNVPAANDPGRVTIHRLNRVEYNNTVRDLLGTTQTPADSFPADDRGYGYDNIADVLSVSPLHLELYHAAAESLIDEVLGSTSPAQGRLLVCAEETSACAGDIVREFARRAWRRPATDAEITRLLAFLDVAEGQGDGFTEGLRLALVSVLVSPSFIFRVEADPDPTSMRPRALTDYELASRLSYFLWSSMPDDTLLELADAGALQDPATLAAQTERMLDDPRAVALIDNFAGQWLYTRVVGDYDPDYRVYPEWDDALAQSMETETKLFFREFLMEDLPITEMMTADWSYLDGRLASHYGVSGPEGSDFVRASLPPHLAAGILSKGSVLSVTSLPTRTSPVKRGVWVLTMLLCSEPPPPPAGVEALEETDTMTSGTLRERMERHSTDPICASCHTTMDPIGFGLETFDGIGRYRTDDGGEPIDSSGQLPDRDGFSGETFSDAAGLGRILAGNERFPQCVAEHMLTYALGRGIETADEHWVESIAATAMDDGGHLRALIVSIVTSDPFRMRRGERE